MQVAETESAGGCGEGASQEKSRLPLWPKQGFCNFQALLQKKATGDSALQKRCPGYGSKFAERIQKMLSLAHFQYPAPLSHPPSPDPMVCLQPSAVHLALD